LALLLTGCGTPFVTRESVVLTGAVPAEALLVRTGFGDVVVRADPSATEVTATATKEGRGNTKAAADAAVQQIEVELAPLAGEPDTLAASARLPKSTGTRNYSVSWEVVGPPDVLVKAQTDFGDVRAEGFRRGLSVATDFGDIKATAGGAVQLQTDFGDIRLELLHDNPDSVSIATDFGDVVVNIPQNRSGFFEASTDFGSVDVSLEGARLKMLRQRDKHLTVELGDAAEPRMEIRTDFGDVAVRMYAPTALAAAP
jgi:hypothetical protein